MRLPRGLSPAFIKQALQASEGIDGLSTAVRGLMAARAAVLSAVAAIDADLKRLAKASEACRRLMLSEIETRLTDAESSNQRKPLAKEKDGPKLVGKTWVTRCGVHIDRIACAWLIRRFIDPEAKFKFVAVKDYHSGPDELRFDMFKGEFTHVGDMCSFEVLLERVGLDDPAVQAIGEIVHDIDLKDGKFGREQTAGIAHVIAGICTSRKDDLARIERGSALFDDTYEYFRKKRGR